MSIKVVRMSEEELALFRSRRMFENAHHMMGADFALSMDDIHAIANSEDKGRDADLARREAAKSAEGTEPYGEEVNEF